jgi:hypothetical protein
MIDPSSVVGSFGVRKSCDRTAPPSFTGSLNGLPVWP